MKNLMAGLGLVLGLALPVGARANTDSDLCEKAAHGSIEAIESCEFIWWQGWSQSLASADQDGRFTARIAEEYMKSQKIVGKAVSRGASSGIVGSIRYVGVVRVSGAAHAQALREHLLNEFKSQGYRIEKLELNTGFRLKFHSRLYQWIWSNYSIHETYPNPELTKDQFLAQLKTYLDWLPKLTAIENYQEFEKELFSFHHPDLKIRVHNYWEQLKTLAGYRWSIEIEMGIGLEFMYSPMDGDLEKDGKPFKVVRERLLESYPYSVIELFRERNENGCYFRTGIDEWYPGQFHFTVRSAKGSHEAWIGSIDSLIAQIAKGQKRVTIQRQDKRGEFSMELTKDRKLKSVRWKWKHGDGYPAQKVECSFVK